MKKLFGSLLFWGAGAALIMGCSSQQRTADRAENEGMKEGEVAGTIEETTPGSPSVGTTTDTGGMAGTTDGAGTTAVTDGPITDTFPLAAGANKEELVGRDVRLDNVRVLKEGQRVNVRGVVRDASELPGGAALAGDREVFISAFHVEEAATLGE